MSLDKETKDVIIRRLDRIQIKAEQIAIEPDPERRKALIGSITEHRRNILQMLLHE